MKRSVYWYVAITWSLAAIAVWVCYRVAPVVTADSIWASLWFAGLVLLGHVARYGSTSGAVQTVAYLPMLAAVAVAPTWFTVLAGGAVAVVSEALEKREVLKKTFNVGKAFLSYAVSILVYRSVGGPALATVSLAPSFVELAPALIVTAIAILLSNSVPVAGVISVSSGRPFRQTWREIALSGMMMDLAAAPLAYLVVRVYVAFGGPGVAWLGLPLLGLRQLYSANWQLKRVNEELLELMVAAIEARDPYTSGHSRRVAQYSRIIAQRLGFSAKQVEEVTKAALLHDVGKIDEKYAPLLRKPSRLTEDEEAVMQTHAARSAELVAKVSNLGSLVLPVRHHHEAWDGTGYPDGLAGERIPLASRIIAFADTIDAMSSERPYRAGLAPSIVRAEIVRCRGTQFDPKLTDQVVSAEVWNAIFPVAEPADRTQSSLVLIPAGIRRRA